MQTHAPSPHDTGWPDALAQAVRRHLGGRAVSGLRRLSGGASQETWAFEAIGADGSTLPLILRRTPGGQTVRREDTAAVGLAVEADVIRHAATLGVPVPVIAHVFAPEEGLGPAYLMSRVEGETIPRKVLRDAAFAAVRPRLARQCGEILARLHAAAEVPGVTLPRVTGRDQLAQYTALYDGYGRAHPMFDYAITWLEDHLPESGRLALVHGDFRNGNLMFGPDGVRAVLDWELTHLGDPREDLSWLCVNSWRFGVTEKTVGGFGEVADLLSGYRDGGGAAVTPEEIRIFEVLGTLKWGIMCLSMYEAFASGYDRSVERAAIGRRASETEIDLVNLLLPRGAP